MLTMLSMIFAVMMFAVVVSAGLRLAWGTLKFVFGLGLFWLCPLVFLVAVLLGGFRFLWLPILLVGLLFGRGYRSI